MNLSRYAVARLQTATAGDTAAEPDAAKLPIGEARIVELTAKWLANAGNVKSGAVRAALTVDGATPVEVALFLEIVGEMGDGTPDAASSKPTQGAGKSVDLESPDRAEDV